MTFYVECKPHDNMTQYQNSIQANVIINEETDTKQKTTR